MSAGFTPGPWRIDGFNEVLAGDPCLDLMVVGQGDYIVAQMVPDRDANLIAAAPELYEALATIVANATVIPDPEMDGKTDCYSVPIFDIEQIAAQALRKARGES